MELAKLGIEATVSGVESAEQKLKRLAGAAKVAEEAIGKLAASRGATTAALNAARVAASSAQSALAAARASETATAADIKAAKAARDKAVATLAAARADDIREASALSTARAVSAQAKADLLAAQALNDNIPGMTKVHNVSNLAAQGFDIVTTAAGGMSAGLIGMQQGLQIAQVAMMSTDGFAKTLAASIAAMLSPVTLLAIGLTTLAAVGIQQVEWAKLAASALTVLADNLQAIAPYAILAGGAMAFLAAPAILAGVTALSQAILGLTARLLGLALGFVMANPAAAFVIGIIAAVAAANIFRDELAGIFGRDIVADAKNGMNAVIGAFVGGYEGIKATWSRLPAAIGDIAVSTANAVITGVENMINNVSSAINGYIQSINSMLQSLPFGVGEGVRIGSIGSVSLGRIGNPYAGVADDVQSSIGDAISGAMGRDYIGAFGEAISRGASAASDKLRELAGSLTATEAAAGKAGGAGKKAGEDTKAGFDAAKAAVDQAKQAFNDAKDTAKGFLSTFRSSLMEGSGFLQSFGEAALNVLDKIIGKVEDELASAIAGAFSGAGSAGGGGGLFGAIFGGIGKLFGFDRGGYTGNGARTQAAGIVHGQEYVFSAAATKRIGVKNLEAIHNRAKGYAGGGLVTPLRPAANQTGGVIVVRTISEVQNGNLVPVMTEVAGEVSGQKISQASPQIVAAANQQVMPTVAKYQRDRAGGDYRNG